MLEITGAVEKRKMKDQLLDSMDLEREKGITIKLTPVRMHYKSNILNLIDTPGHVDFNYEVSRSLAAVDGAVLLVDATQGVQAQTIANLYLALDQGLEIIPVLNKIDLPAADIPRRTQELVNLVGCNEADILYVSGKTGEGVEALLDEIVRRVPPPSGSKDKPLRALIFDSFYDEYKGVVAHVRIVDGEVKRNARLHLCATKTDFELIETGWLDPFEHHSDCLETGQIGYVATGLKTIDSCRVGDTVTLAGEEVQPLSGYKVVVPMVYSGIFPKDGDSFEALRDAMMKINLSDASLKFEPEHSRALGYGFRCGFLGMLHMEIIQERLAREFNLDVIVTVPSVHYKANKTNGEMVDVKSPADMPEASRILSTEEPWMRVDVVVPTEYIGNVMALCMDKRGIYKNTEYLGESRTILHFELPLSSIVIDFYDRLKSVTAGYASMSYEFMEYREAEIVRLDVNVAEEPVEALSSLVFAEDAYKTGKAIVEKLKETIPKQMFVIKLQALVGGKIIASERISAMRKDVTAKLYGGDVTRKRKLLEKQKKGKAKMMAHGKGSVEIPASAYLAVLKR
jgi:GTP-binding protein LepA